MQACTNNPKLDCVKRVKERVKSKTKVPEEKKLASIKRISK